MALIICNLCIQNNLSQVVIVIMTLHCFLHNSSIKQSNSFQQVKLLHQMTLLAVCLINLLLNFKEPDPLSIFSLLFLFYICKSK